MKGFLVAGPASGVGKTTTSLALCAALRARGLTVQAFKCGPDFLDTGHLSAVTGRPARNLDGWMLDEAANRNTFVHATADADIAIVEGMMGLFDGISGQADRGSAAEIAKWLSLPVILVLDASNSARSIAAVLRGFEVFDPALRFAGVVLNGVAGQSHYRTLRDAVRSTSSTPLLGWLPREESVRIPERHLGLRTAQEEPAWDKRKEAFAAVAEKQFALDELLRSTPDLPVELHREQRPTTSARASIGVAQDRAFCFYYQDNLDLLERAGARIVPFSPLRDAHLPKGIDALYLGGGYPEIYAPQLSANTSLATEIRAFAQQGRPIYAECGGMMYLSEQLRRSDGQVFPMTGVLPVEIEMTEGLVRFGYVEVDLMRDCLLGTKGTALRGHSFHYSRSAATREMPAAFHARYTLSGKSEEEGVVFRNVLASYVHLHFGGAPSIATTFVRTAEEIAHSLAEAR
jgi:cobyrinic acid a,c-diamide synthase